MEMMEGGELFHRISQHKHFTEKMASQVTKEVLIVFTVKGHTVEVAQVWIEGRLL